MVPAQAKDHAVPGRIIAVTSAVSVTIVTIVTIIVRIIQTVTAVKHRGLAHYGPADVDVAHHIQLLTRRKNSDPHVATIDGQPQIAPGYTLFYQADLGGRRVYVCTNSKIKLQVRIAPAGDDELIGAVGLIVVTHNVQHAERVPAPDSYHPVLLENFRTVTSAAIGIVLCSSGPACRNQIL